MKNQKPRILEEILTYSRITKGESQKILDLGGAPFYTDVILHRAGHQLDVVDIAPERFEGFASEFGINVVKGNIELEKLPAEDCSYDGVILAEVFEHLRIDLNFTVSEIFRVLKPGGWFYLSTPNMFSYRRLWTLITKGIDIRNLFSI